MPHKDYEALFNLIEALIWLKYTKKIFSEDNSLTTTQLQIGQLVITVPGGLLEHAGPSPLQLLTPWC